MATLATNLGAGEKPLQPAKAGCDGLYETIPFINHICPMYSKYWKRIIFALCVQFIAMVSSGQKESSESLKSLIRVYSLNHSAPEKADTVCLDWMSRLADQLRAAGDYTNALLYCDTGIVALEKLVVQGGEQEKMKKVYNLLVMMYQVQGITLLYSNESNKALESFKGELRIAELYGNYRATANANGYLSNCFSSMMMVDKAFEYVDKAIATPGIEKYPSNLADFYGTKARLFMQVLNNDSAGYYLRKSMKIFRDVHDESASFLMNLNMLSFCATTLQLDSLETYLVQIEPALDELGGTQDRVMYLTYKGLNSMNVGEFGDCIRTLDEAVDLAKGQGDYKAMEYAYSYKSLCYAGMGMIDSAVYYGNLSKENMLKMFDVEKVAALAESEASFTHEKEQAISALELKRQKTLKTGMAIGGSLVTFLALLLFRQWRMSKKNEERVKEKKEQIELAYEQLQSTQSQLVFTERQREAEKIRVSIARDIHDEIGSGLTKISLLTELVKRKMVEDPVYARDSLSNIAKYSRGVNEALSEIVWAVNPQHDNVDALINYSKSFAQEFLKDTEVKCDLHFATKQPEHVINPELKRNIFLVLKEGLNNAMKYSRANVVGVSLEVEDNLFHLKISDDGVGFDSVETMNKGNGLMNMQMRMTQLGCRFAITSSPGKGCSVEAWGNIE